MPPAQPRTMSALLRAQRRLRERAHADDLGRHALADLRLRRRAGEVEEVGVRVHVDEARRRPLARWRRSRDRPGPPRPGPTAAMRSPSTATSAARAGAPLPSITEPPRIRSDQAIAQASWIATVFIRSPCLMRSTCSMPARHLAEHGVVAVEVRRGRRSRCRTGCPPSPGAGCAPWPGVPRTCFCLLNSALIGVAGAAGAVALGAAALHHEVRDDAVEAEAVVEALLGQRDEVLDGLGRVLREELEVDLVAVLERDDRGLLHESPPDQ